MFDIDSERFLRLYAHFEHIKKGTQLKKLAEEQAELNNSLLLYQYGINPIEDVIQEMADNFILLLQHMYVNDIDLETLKNAILKKLDRTDERILNGYYEKH